METAKVRVKKWGNSFGVVIPKDIVNKQGIKEGINLRINIQVENKTRAKDIFGIMKGRLIRDTDDLLKKVDEDFENE